MAWSDDEEQRLAELYFSHTYHELSDILDRPRGTIQGKVARMDLPEKTQANELEWRYGVPLDWLLDTLHNTLGKPIVDQMADELDVSHGWIQNQMAERGIHKRNPSEAAGLKWQEMSEAERREQARPAFERAKEKFENGTHPLVRWREENPERAKEVYEQARHAGPLARDENGMKGVTGQDSPTWLGGRSVYGAIKKQFHGQSWEDDREQHLADECRVCGDESELVLHHIIPIMAGGTNDSYNYMTLCRSCHGTVEWQICRHFDTVLAE